MLGPIPRHALLSFALVFYSCMAAIAIAWSRATEQSLFASAFKTSDVEVYALDIGVGLGAALLFHLFTRVSTERLKWSRELAEWMQEELGHLTIGDALFLALLSGVAEELLFRGPMLSHWGLAASTVLFALVHWAPKPELRAWPWMAGAIGLLFGGLVLWRGSLLVSIAAHIGINFMNLAYLIRRGENKAEE